MTDQQVLHADMNRGLFWVKGELTQCLQRVRCQIESYLEAPGEDTQALSSSLNDVKQLASIASVIQCYSVHLLAEEMQQTLNTLLQDAGNKAESSFAALVSATLQLGDYVELLAHGETDHPLMFAPVINELRLSRGSQIYPRAQLFQRFIEVRGQDVVPPPSAHRKPGMSKALAAKHAGVLQKAVLGVIRNENRARCLQVLGKAASQLASVVVDPRLYQCWRGIEAMAQVLANEDKTLAPDLQKLVAKVGQCVKALAANGEPPVARAAGILGAQTLHLLSVTDVRTPSLDAIREEFGFPAESLSEEHLQALRARLSQPNIESLQTVTREIRNSLHDIKDTIDLALRSGGQAQVADNLTASLNTLGATLSVLGLDALGQLAEQQAQQVSMLDQAGSEDEWMQVAETLIRIEHGLDAELMPARRSVVLGDAEHHQDLREGVSAVLRESLVNIARIKSELDRYISRGQIDGLENARNLLSEISSAFDLLGMAEAGAVLTRVRDTLQPEQIESVRTHTAVADRLADIVAGVEYFLEAVQENQPHTGRLLEDVESYLRLLAEAITAAPSQLETAAAVAVVEDAQEVDPEFRDIFIEESREVLAELDELMPRWTQNPTDEELLGGVRRGFHTLKGSGRMVGAVDIGEFAWGLEDVLNRCRDGALKLDSQVSELVTEAVRLLPELIQRFEQGQTAQEQIEPIAQRVRAILGQDDVADPSAEVLPVFLEDAATSLDELAELTHEVGALEVSESLVRLMHTLRGGAAAVGQDAFSQEAAVAESLLQTLRGLSQPVAAELLTRLHASFSTQLQALRDGQPVPTDAGLTEEMSQLLQSLVASPDGIDLELAAIFSEEALDLLEQAESELRNWSNRPDSDEAQQHLQRIFHTLKGSARTAGAMGLGQVGEALDSLMKGVLIGDVQDIDQALFERIARAITGSYNLLDEFREGRDGDPSPLLALLSGQTAGEFDAEPVEAASGAQADATDDTSDLAAEPETAVAPESPPLDEDDFSGDIQDIWPPDEEIMQLFLAEGEELLESIDQHFAAWESNQNEAEPLRALQRDLHTFKGGARMAGLNSLGAIAHEMETSFAALEQGAETDAGLFGRVHSAIDGLHHLLDGVKQGQPPLAAHELLADLRGDWQSPQTDEQAVDMSPSMSDSPQADAVLQPAPEAVAGERVEAMSAPDPDAQATDTQRDDAPDEELVEIFVPEAAELMEALDAARDQFMAGHDDAAARGEILRVLHTLKGGARMAGLRQWGDEVHALETRFEHDQGEDRAALLSQLEQASDRFHAHLQQAKAGAWPAEPATAPAEGPSENVVQAADVIDVPEMPAAPVSAAAPVARAWSDSLHWEAPTDERLAAIRRETARVSVEQLDSMLNEAGEISIYRSRLERQVNSISGNLREVEQTIARIRDQLRALETETDAQIQARTKGLHTGNDADRYEAEFDPLEMDRYSRMQELTRALSESVTDLSSLHTSMTDVVSETDTLLLQQGRVNTSVQQGLMSTLMVPFSRQVQRLQRVVRQTAGDHGKQVDLRMHGIEAEMDRNVLERMTPVIEHVIRNCVIHGLERPEDRQANGKPAMGTVSIALSREGSKLAIEVRDDGRGLDFERIRTKAIDKGMMGPDDRLSEAEMAQFIFQPGFSTAEALTQDAGRGVGMDVVSAEVKQLGGTLELDSQTGKGARFVIRLPLSLAISQALMVQVGDEVYATPLANIEGIARLPADEIANFLDDEQNFAYGGHEYRVRYLGQLLGLDAKLPEERAYVPVILVHTGEGMGISDRRVAVAVDQLLGSRELVTKTAGPQVSTVVGVTGATIQSDGRVVLILDVVALVQDRLFKTLTHATVEDSAASQRAAEPMVMVIDDSITMRRVAERVLTRNGYRVATAKDGMDGIAQLQSDTPDAVLLDIEMPKVDGFEVATFIRNNERLANVPIIMITSRSGDKHRERAKSIGVNRYLIKPYQEQQLIDELHQVMGESA